MPPQTPADTPKERPLNVSKEPIYDEKISPLMAQVIAICHEHKINMAATFSLDPEAEEGPLFCSTVLPVDKDDEVGFQRVNELRRVMYPKPSFMAFTITHSEPSP
jgi:hypothetical protein